MGNIYYMPIYGQIELITEFPDRYIIYYNIDKIYCLYKTGLYEKIEIDPYYKPEHFYSITKLKYKDCVIYRNSYDFKLYKLDIKTNGFECLNIESDLNIKVVI